MDVPPSYLDRLIRAHGICAALAWVILFPTGAILLRYIKHPKVLQLHIAVQLLAYSLFCITFGSGVWFLYLFKNFSGHPILGIIIFGFATIQVASGALHHRRYLKVQRRTFFGVLHSNWGRALISIAMVNGGYGLAAAANANRAEQIAYGLIAGLMWVTLMVATSNAEKKRWLTKDNDSRPILHSLSSGEEPSPISVEVKKEEEA